MDRFNALSQLLVPALIFYIVAAGIFARKNVYEHFMKGAKDGLFMAFKIMPTMIALLMAVNVLRASGFLDYFSEIFSPLAEKIHFPAPLVPLAFVKTFSGSAATGLLLDIFKEYGADSTIGRIASVMLSSTETIFYTMSLYFVSVGIRKTRYTMAGCLAATAAGIAASVFFAG